MYIYIIIILQYSVFLYLKINENIPCHYDYEYILFLRKARYEKTGRIKLNFGFALTPNSYIKTSHKKKKSYVLKKSDEITSPRNCRKLKYRHFSMKLSTSISQLLTFRLIVCRGSQRTKQLNQFETFLLWLAPDSVVNVAGCITFLSQFPHL